MPVIFGKKFLKKFLKTFPLKKNQEVFMSHVFVVTDPDEVRFVSLNLDRAFDAFVEVVKEFFEISDSANVFKN